MDDMIQERVTQKENELNAEYDERLRNYEERSVDPVYRMCGGADVQREGPSEAGEDCSRPVARLAYVE
jgi:homeobox protein cut-like